MNKTKISKYILLISITTFLAIFFYIVQSSYNNLIQPSRDVVKSDLLRPINPNIDRDVLDQVESKTFNQNNSLIFNPPPEISPTQSP